MRHFLPSSLSESNPSELDKLPRMKSVKLNATMLSVSEEEGQKAMELQTELEAKVIVDPSDLSGMEKMIGIKAKDIMDLKEKA